MNEHQYTNIRSYLEDIAGKQAQLVKLQQRTNELLERALTPFPTVDLTPEQAAGIDLSQEGGQARRVAQSASARVQPASLRAAWEQARDVFVDSLETEPPPEVDEIMPAPAASKPKSKSPVEVMPKATKPDFTVTRQPPAPPVKKPAAKKAK